EKYRPRNLLDLKYLWFKSLQDHLGYHQKGSVQVLDDTLIAGSTSLLSSFPLSSSPVSLATPPTAAEVTGPGGYILWSVFPAVGGMRQIVGGLSGMLTRLCGWKLNKSQQCSHWEQRPLNDEQLLYA
ncbi:hypothetical protein BGZ65_012333, partial [Modicella reniformis]